MMVSSSNQRFANSGLRTLRRGDIAHHCRCPSCNRAVPVVRRFHDSVFGLGWTVWASLRVFLSHNGIEQQRCKKLLRRTVVLRLALFFIGAYLILAVFAPLIFLALQ